MMTRTRYASPDLLINIGVAEPVKAATARQAFCTV